MPPFRLDTGFLFVAVTMRARDVYSVDCYGQRMHVGLAINVSACDATLRWRRRLKHHQFE